MQTVIYGRNIVKEALIAKRNISTVLISKTARGVKEIIELANNFGVAIEFSDPKKINSFSEKTQGVVAFCEKIKFFELRELLNFCEKNSSPIIVICVGIKDPHNLGAIFRTAAAFGADGIVLPKKRIAPINATVEKSSAGAINFLKISKVANISYAIKILKKFGFFIYCADLKGEDFRKVNFKGPSCLVVGSEEKGPGPLIKKHCDKLCRIPIKKDIDSLNVSVATAIILSEIWRQNDFTL